MAHDQIVALRGHAPDAKRKDNCPQCGISLPDQVARDVHAERTAAQQIHRTNARLGQILFVVLVVVFVTLVAWRVANPPAHPPLEGRARLMILVLVAVVFTRLKVSVALRTSTSGFRSLSFWSQLVGFLLVTLGPLIVLRVL